LTGLYCSNNFLSSLDVSNHPELHWLNCSNNNIQGSAMDALINSLPRNSFDDNGFYVINLYGDGNVCTESQVAVAKSKGWIPYFYFGRDWWPYQGSDETVSISEAAVIVDLRDGKTIFSLSGQLHTSASQFHFFSLFLGYLFSYSYLCSKLKCSEETPHDFK